MRDNHITSNGAIEDVSQFQIGLVNPCQLEDLICLPCPKIFLILQLNLL